ncbi:MAG: M28 family peptidase [Dethiobacteria bacterium]
MVFELPGNGSTDEVILVGTHYDTGHFTGAVDNNGSVALMIKWAEYFAGKPKESRNRDMIFAWCLGHDFDLNSGHYQFAEAHKEQLKKAIVWDVDHAVGGVRYVYDETLGKLCLLKAKLVSFI